MITSPACATAYARLFNISDATTLAIVAANVNAIQEGCTRVTNEALSPQSQRIMTMTTRPWCRQYAMPETSALLSFMSAGSRWWHIS